MNKKQSNAQFLTNVLIKTHNNKCVDTHTIGSTSKLGDTFNFKYYYTDRPLRGAQVFYANGLVTKCDFDKALVILCMQIGGDLHWSYNIGRENVSKRIDISRQYNFGLDYIHESTNESTGNVKNKYMNQIEFVQCNDRVQLKNTIALIGIELYKIQQ